MKNLLIAILVLSINLFAQEFSVEKVKGNVKYLKGTSENWEVVSPGTKLNGNDFIETEENSFIQLNKSGKPFILKSSSALGLNYLKEISVNDLLLALAMEEIRNVPQKKTGSSAGNTAVYGSKINTKDETAKNEITLGIKRLNGAKQLSEFGYNESAIIVAKETYRNYPSTKELIQERLFFVEVLVDLKLYEEALSELNEMRKYSKNEKENLAISEKINQLKLEIL